MQMNKPKTLHGRESTLTERQIDFCDIVIDTACLADMDTLEFATALAHLQAVLFEESGHVAIDATVFAAALKAGE